MNIKKRLIEKAKKLNMSVFDLFNCESTLSYLSDLGFSLTGKPQHIIVLNDPGTTASTSGERVTFSAASPLISYYPALPEQFMSGMGHFIHEWAHCIFMDFDVRKTQLEEVLNGKIPGTEMPENEKQLAKALKNADYRSVFFELYRDIENVLADAHDERCMVSKFGKFASEPLAYVHTALRASFKPIEEELKEGNLNALMNALLRMARWDDFLMADEEVLRADPITAPLIGVLDQCRPLCQEARTEDSMLHRFDIINEIVILMLPFILDDIKQREKDGESRRSACQGAKKSMQDAASKAGSSSEPSGTSSNTARSMRKAATSSRRGSGSSAPNSTSSGDSGASIRGSTNNGADHQDESPAKKAGSTENGEEDQMPEKESQSTGKPESVADGSENNAEKDDSNDNSADNSPDDESSSEQEAEDGTSNKDGNQGSEHAESEPNQSDESGDEEQGNPFQDIYKRIEDRAREEIAEGMIENENCDHDRKIMSSVDGGKIHSRIKIFCPPLSQTGNNKAEYELIAKRNQLASKQLRKEVLAKLQDMDIGGIQKRLINGKRLEAADTWRPDYGWFSNKKDPQDPPDVAIAILVDESGSMAGGNRIMAAKEAAIMLYEAYSGIFPIGVFGHDADSYRMILRTYVPFDQVSKKSRYRLTQIHAGGDNRDGLAILSVGELLLKRPEAIKILLVISDGEPLHCSVYDQYAGKIGVNDTKARVSEIRKKGVETIGFAIGADRDAIRRIYGDAYIDISDLKRLPKTMASILHRKILAEMD